MLHKTTGIVFKTTKYSDSSIIVKVYTEKFGLQTYIINGIRSANSKNRAGIYQHGNILDMVVYYRETGNIFRISEAKISAIYNHIPFDILKSSLVLLYVEVLNKVIKEEESNPELFAYIERTFRELDGETIGLANHHLHFLLGLSRYLGFYPDADSEGKYFNLQEGYFDELPSHVFFIEEKLSSRLKDILRHQSVSLTAAERRALLQHLLNYFRMHVTGFGELRSPAILEELFR